MVRWFDLRWHRPFTSARSRVQHRDTSAALLPSARVWTFRGRLGWTDAQTLLSGTDNTQRQAAEPYLMTPCAHLSVAAFPNSQGSLEMPQIPHRDVSSDKREGKTGEMASRVSIVRCVWECRTLLTWESFHHNYEAGGRTTLETKIVKRGKHEISYHLLWCLNPSHGAERTLNNAILSICVVIYRSVEFGSCSR